MKRWDLAGWVVASKGVQVFCVGLHASALEQGGDADARPARVAHRPVCPLQPRHDRPVQPAPIARALKHARPDNARHAAEIVNRQLQWTCDLTVDRQRPRPWIRNDGIPVMSDKEKLVRRDVRRQQVEGRLRVDRIRIQLQQPAIYEAGSLARDR
jgi:hypothetical protein